MKVLTSLLALCIGAAVMLGVIEVGRASTDAPLVAQAGSGSAVTIPPFIDAGPGELAADTSTAAPQPAPKPSDTIHDPTTDPGAALGDVKAAKKYGWGAALFAVLLMLGRVAAKAKSIAPLAWLGKGRTAVVVAGAMTVLAGCYDAAMQGGSWTAIGIAAAVAFGTFYNSHGSSEPKA